MLDVDDGRVSPLDRLSQELGQLLLFPPTCCLAGGHPNFHLLGFRASPKFPPFQMVNESCSFLVFLSLFLFFLLRPVSLFCSFSVAFQWFSAMLCSLPLFLCYALFLTDVYFL